MTRFKSYLSGEGLGALLARAFVGSAGLQIAGMGLGFLVGVQLARGLAPEGYGVYAWGMSVSALLGMPTEFGLPQLMTREVATANVHQAWSRMKGFILFSAGLVATTSVLMFAAGEILLATTDLVPDAEKRSALRWGLLLIPVVAQTKLCGSALQGLGRIVVGQFANLVLRPGLFALFLFLAFVTLALPRRPSTAMELQIMGAAVAMLVSMVFFAVSLPRKTLHVKAAYDSKRWIASAFPMALTEGMRALQGNVAVFMLGLLSTTGEIGLFRVADSTAAVCGLPASMLNIIAASIFARLWAEKDHIRIQRLVQTIALLISVGVLTLSLPILLDGRRILELIFGSRFGDAMPPLLISCCSNLLFGLFGPCSTLLNMTGGEKRVARAFAISVVINLSIAACLIPHFGAIGAAIGNMAGIFALNLLIWLDCRRTRGIDTSLMAIFYKQR